MGEELHSYWFYLHLSDFSHLSPTFTHHPAALIPLSADLLRKICGKEASCSFSTFTVWFIQSFWGFITHFQGPLAWATPCLHAKPHTEIQRMNLRPFSSSSYLPAYIFSKVNSKFLPLSQALPGCERWIWLTWILGTFLTQINCQIWLMNGGGSNGFKMDRFSLQPARGMEIWGYNNIYNGDGLFSICSSFSLHSHQGTNWFNPSPRVFP